ncbi:hypothetical protein RB653_002485 [Dictyostelium firmibasis]|uniref:IPT/TIG domain-containing protein n=1 Tax=Dictyostelium firmibasis TaxID=79012 RepID=A0AAN7TWI6_9MYCE
MKLTISFFLIIFIIFPIYCQTFSPKDFKNTEKSITFEWDISNPTYYTKWEITKTIGSNVTFFMNFTCTNTTTIRSCTYINTGTPPMNDLYGVSAMPCFMNDSVEICQGSLQLSHYPTPIINSSTPSTIPTDGGTLTLKGAFIIFIVDSQKTNFALSSGGVSNYSYPIDPTNVDLKIPSGCNGDSILWPSGSSTAFKYTDPSITSTPSLSADGNTVIVNGINFCTNKTGNKVSAYLGGILQSQQSIVITSSTSFQLDVSSLLYTETQDFYMMLGSKKMNNSNTTLSFSPFLTSINSVPANIGGTIIIKGKRLTSPPGTNPNTYLQFDSTCDITSVNPSYITCDIQPGYIKPTNFFIMVSNVMSLNNLTFNYNILAINNYTQNGSTITLFGDCLGNSLNSPNISIGGTVPITGILTSQYETSLSFELLGNYSVNITLYVRSYDITWVLFDISPTLYVIPGDLISNSGGLTHFKYYFIKPNNIKPTITINNVVFEGTDSSKDLKDDGSYAYDFDTFPPICGSVQLQYAIGDQVYTSSITSQPSTFGNCTFYPGTNLTTCTGTNFGGSFFKNQVHIQLSNDTINPTNLTDTEFSFYTNDNYISGHLLLTSCGVSTDLYYNLDPIYYSNTATGFHNYSVSDAVIINGKFFSSSSIASVSCNGSTFSKCDLIDYETISCPVQLIGPYDLQCALNFLNDTNIPVYVSFLQPIALSSTSLYLNGGQLVIFGDSFYPQIQNIQVGSIQCTNYVFIATDAIACNLQPTTNKDLLNQLLFVNITIAGKSGGGNVFTYIIPWYLEFEFNSVNSMIIITTIIIAIAIASVYIQFAYLFYKKKNNKREKISLLTSKPINQRQQLTRQLTQPLFVIPQQTSSSRSNSISRY